jgi:hypothetical protein
MYDVNPLGPMMHLKELERQAIPKLRSVRSMKQPAFSLAVAVMALLRRLHAVGSHRRAATESQRI